MPSEPCISVIVPVRNRRDLLQKALAALSVQTFPNFEVMVVDDGSTDGSAEEAAAWARSDSRIRLAHTETVGAVAARRAGIAASQAGYLAFTDSDCQPAPDWLEAGVRRLEAGVDLVQGLTLPADPVRPLQRSLWSDFDDGLYPTCNLFVRRAAYDAAGGFDTDLAMRLGFRSDRKSQRLGLGEDTVLGWRIRRRGRAVFAPEVKVAHHVFAADLPESLRRAWSVGAFPGLVRQVPELRRTLLVDGYFLGSRSRLPLYSAMAAALSRRWAPALAGLSWWAVARYRHVARLEPVVRRRVKVLPAELVLDALRGVALLSGSARYRRLVL